MSTDITKYQGVVSEVRELLSRWFESGVDLFLKLKEIDASGVWKHPGHATFGDFLRAEFPTALGIERYQNVINAINVYGVERVKQIGIESCHALTVKALVEDEVKRTKVLSGIDNFVKTNGCAPDRNKVRELVAAVAPETKKSPKELRLDEETERMRTELALANKEIRDLKRENARLTKEVEKLRARGAVRKATSGKGRKAA